MSTESSCETEHTVEVEVHSLGRENTTVELSPGEEEEFSASTVAFTVRALETESD